MNALKKLSPYAHWGIRLAVAGVFLFHGLGKFADLSGGAQMMGMPVFVWALVAIFESLGGALVLLGGFLPDWATRLGGLLIIPPMLGAVFMAHWGQWSFAPSATHPMGGMEFQVTLLTLGIFFALRGKEIEKAL
ncbi:MAG: DoxX family membrane protein [Anaerolineales bacterium]|nr:DoxX family membrane protein [Chloroflexota bacterium]MBL6982701.1 DoxX family membrane protein [Anaerolineales bacterium]